MFRSKLTIFRYTCPIEELHMKYRVFWYNHEANNIKIFAIQISLLKTHYSYLSFLLIHICIDFLFLITINRFQFILVVIFIYSGNQHIICINNPELNTC
jgi:hypothetical protein